VSHKLSSDYLLLICRDSTTTTLRQPRQCSATRTRSFLRARASDSSAY